jgi:uncharacterized membrane protein
VERMKQVRKYTYPLLHGIYLIITLIFDAYAYTKLPEKISTQFSLSGGAVNTMPKLVYMLISVGIILILYIMGIHKSKIDRIKFTIINTIIVVANIVMLAVQL